MTQHMAAEELPLPIQTTRLTIRAPTPTDIPEWLALNASENERRFFGGVIDKSEAETAQTMTLKRGGLDEQLSISDRQTGTFIGQCGFLFSLEVPNMLELYCLLKQANHGKGIGREVCAAMVETALCRLRKDWVYGVIQPDNVVCIKMVQSLGFEFARSYDNPFRPRQRGHHVFTINLERYEASKSCDL